MSDILDLDQLSNPNPESADPVNLNTIASRAESKATDLDQVIARKQGNLKNSLNSKLGFDPDSLEGRVTNSAAALFSGATRVAGNIITAPIDTVADAAQANVPNPIIDAYSRVQRKQPQPGDIETIDQQELITEPGGIAQTYRQRLDSAQGLRDISKNIADAADYSKLIDTDSRDSLTDDLAFSTKKGVANLKESLKSFDKGNYFDSAMEVVKGLGQTGAGMAESIVSNPAAVGSYAVENLPQLVIGAPAQAVANAGYGLDVYRQGLTEYAEKNQGALPASEDLAGRGMAAASAALAEHVGEMGMSKALLNPTSGLKAGVKEFASTAAKEGVTEGYQEWAEGKAKGEDATLERIIEATAIGAAVGGALHGAGELTHLGSKAGETVGKVAESVEQTKEFKSAVDSGDVTGLAAKDPVRAVYALHDIAQKGTPEEQAKRVEEADQIKAGLQTRISDLKSVVESNSPAGIEQLTKQRDAVQAQIATAAPADVQGLQDDLSFFNESIAEAAKYDPKEDLAAIAKLEAQATGVELASGKLRTLVAPKGEALDAVVAQANTPVAQATPESQAAVSKVMTLTMENPDAFTAEHIDSLVADTSNGFSVDQRAALQTFSEAKQAQDKFKDLYTVNSEIMKGGAGYMGIPQYREAVRTALAQNNVTAAETIVGSLGKFAERQASKAQAVAEAFKQVEGTNKRVYLADTDGVWAPVEAGKSKLYIGNKSGQLVSQVQAEADVLAKTTAAYAALVKSTTAPVAVEQAPVPAPAVENMDTAPVTDPVAPDVKEAAAVQAEPKKEAVAETDSVYEPTLTAVNKPVVGMTAENYKDLELVAEFFDQSAGKPDSTSAKPLAALKDFMSSLRSKKVNINDFVELNKDWTTVQKGTIKKFNDFTNFLNGKIGEKPKDYIDQSFQLVDFNKNGEAKYRFLDYAQFFRNEDGSIDENVRTAVALAAFNYINENAGTLKNTPEAINAILGRSSDTDVSEREEGLLAYAGKRQALVVDSLGAAMMESLGLSANSKAPAAEQARMRTSLGSAVVSVLVNAGYAKKHQIMEAQLRPLRDGKKAVLTSTLKPQDTKAITDLLKTGKLSPADANILKLAVKTGNVGYAQVGIIYDAAETAPKELKVALNKIGAELNARTYSTFVALNSVKDGKKIVALKRSLDIRAASLGSENILNKLFGSEGSAVEPSYEPIKYNQPKARKTQMEIPSLARKILAKETKKPHTLRKDMWTLWSALSDQTLQKIAGVVDMDTTPTHIDNMAGREAKNAGLMEQIDNARSFFGNMVSTVGIDQPMYFDRSFWKNQRVGIVQTLINPQTSKVHRSMLSMEGFDTTIKMNDSATMELYKLRVLEALGKKTENFTKEDSMKMFDKEVSKPEIQAAVAAIADILNGKTNVDEAVIAAGVAKGGENFHTFEGLVALATMKNAVAEGKTEVTLQLKGEVDGVTNGPMLSLLMLGAKGWDTLTQGGFFPKDSPFTALNESKAVGNLDLYQSTISAALAMMPKGDRQLANLQVITGMLQESSGTVTKAGRNIIKKPLTAMMFGSSTSAAVADMADGFVDMVYARIEELARDNDTAGLKTLFNAVNELTKAPSLQIDPNMDFKTALETSLTYPQRTALVTQFDRLIGQSVKDSLEENYADYLSRRNTVNQTAELAFNLFNAASQALTEVALANMPNVPRNKAGVALTGLTKAQTAEMQKKLAPLEPILHTFMSKKSGELQAGMHMSKNQTLLDNSEQYQSQINLAGRVATLNSKGVMESPAKAKVSGMRFQYVKPGAAPFITGIHSFDSGIAMLGGYGQMNALNVHDAMIVGLQTAPAVGKTLNQATIQNMMEYSVANEMVGTLERTVMGLQELMKDSEVAAVLQPKLNELLKEDSIEAKLEAMRKAATEADVAKAQYIADMATVDQYATEQGAYTLTEADHAKANQLIQDAGKYAAAPLAAAKAIDKLAGIKPAVKVEAASVAAQSAWGTLGTPAVASSDTLVKALEAKPIMSGRELADMVQAQADASPFTKQLMSMVKRVTKPSLAVKYVTAQTGPQEAEGTGVTKARGWFFSDNGRQTIFVKSPEFAESGVTTELLAHELTHAAIGQVIQNELDAKAADSKYSSDAYELVSGLETLRAKATEVAKGQPQFANALSNVQEFVAWGMTNLEFQSKVLAKIAVTRKESSNPLVTGLRDFIEKITGLLFGKRADKLRDTAMGQMLENVSGLFAEAAKAPKEASKITLAMQNAVNNVKSMTTEQVYTSLQEKNTGHVTSDRHDANLRALIAGPITTLFGPMGAFKEKAQADMALTEEDIFLKAMNTNKLPFASNSLGVNFVLNEHEAFVLEQVEATVSSAFEAENNYEIRSALSNLRKEAMVALKGKLSQDKYDYLFSQEASAVGKSHYLSRFAALGLASQEVNDALGFSTALNATDDKNKSIGARLTDLFGRIVARIMRLHTKTRPGQLANTQLGILVDRLVDIEAIRMRKQAAAATDRISQFENKVDAATDKLKAGAVAFANSTFFTVTDNAFAKATSGMIKTIAEDRVHIMGDLIKQIRNARHPNKQEGVAAGLLTEVMGDTDANRGAMQLLAMAKESERVRQKTEEIIRGMVTASYEDKGAYLTPDDKKAITTVMLRTDVQSLMAHTGINGLMDVMRDQTKMDKLQATLESQVKAMPNGRAMVGLAKDLAYYMTTGGSTSAATVLNTHNIARMYGQSAKANRALTNDQIEAAVAVLDPLVSVYALAYTSPEQKAVAMKVFEREHKRGAESGVEMTLLTHRDLQKEALDYLFQGSEAHRIQGYVPELHDTKIDAFAIGLSEVSNYLKRGYRVVGNVQEDPHAPHPEQRVLISRRSSGSDAILSGAMSYTSNGTKGTLAAAKTFTLQSDQTWKIDDSAIKKITTERQVELDAALNRSDSYDPRKQKSGRAIPILDAQGKIVNYRYVMTHATRDAVLFRDNNMDTLLGRFAGQNVDKIGVTDQNYTVVSAMYDQYREDYASNPNAYVVVGRDSTDPELAELYRLMPQQAKKDIQKIWGEHNMHIRSDQLNIIMGYRKFSLTQMFDKQERPFGGSLRKDPTVRSFGEDVFVRMAESIMGEKAQWKVGKAEDVVQEVNAWIKDTIVVRNLSTLAGNIKSNLSLMMIQGVPLKDIANAHAIGLRAALDYRGDSKREVELQRSLDMGFVPQGVAAIENELVEIRDRLTRNPIKPLVDAGLMPTIAEDIEAYDTPYTYKGRTATWIDAKTKRVPDGLKTVVKNVLMTHDTSAYKFLSQTTQLSDLIARYVTYQHITTRARNPLTKAQALRQVENDFVNYDRPSHKMVEYLNSVGVLRFTKYFLRIQKTLARILREKPLRSLAAVTAGSYFSSMEVIFDSSWIHHIGNPLHVGPVDAFAAVNQLPLINLVD